MPGPGVYVIGVVGTIAAGMAFKEYVYEPYIAPKLEQWAEEFVAKRKAKRLQKQGLVAVSAHSEVPSPQPSGSDVGKTPDFLGFNKRRDSIESDLFAGPSLGNRSIELEHLVSKELREWRTEGTSGLRHRKNTGSASESTYVSMRRTYSQMDESNPSIPYAPISLTHVLYDSSSTPSTPTSTVGFTGQISPAPRSQTPHKVSRSMPRSSQSLSTASESSRSVTLSSTPAEMRSLATAPWVAQQLELARSNPLADYTDFSSRSSTPFSHVSCVSNSLSLPNSLSPEPTNLHEVPAPRQQGSLMTLHRQDAPVVASPVGGSRPLSPASVPSASAHSTLTFPPVVQSLSFTHPTHEDSRPGSSLSFTSDANVSYSARSDLSFAQSDPFTDDDFADVISVSSGSAI
ncbi:hypothetical protein HGRIS_010290 [Hohenbuehelia grisea]|uniref:Transmembrane protein n=1 Tax=Hohenbuehelia grisea TaxID=104357 RepID=A0ABR3J3U8_9AGAR